MYHEATISSRLIAKQFWELLIPFNVFIFTLCAYIGPVNNVAGNCANKKYINVTLLTKMPEM